MSVARAQGVLVAGKYLIEARVGSGGMSEVYRARNQSIDRLVAIKFLLPSFAEDQRAVRRFLKEGELASKVRHPNVVDILDVDRDADGTPFIVQDYLRGEDLDAHVAAKGGKLTVREALDILTPIAEALGCAHARGVVHRDVKPANIFLSLDQSRCVPKLVDFGIARIESPTKSQTQGKDGGTPAYMSPEHIATPDLVAAPADVWALGVVLYEVLTGELPFDGPTLADMFVRISKAPYTPLGTLLPTIAPELEALVARCLAKSSKDRFPDGNALAAEMNRLRAGYRSVPPPGERTSVVLKPPADLGSRPHLPTQDDLTDLAEPFEPSAFTPDPEPKARVDADDWKPLARLDSRPIPESSGVRSSVFEQEALGYSPLDSGNPPSPSGPPDRISAGLVSSGPRPKAPTVSSTPPRSSAKSSGAFAMSDLGLPPRPEREPEPEPAPPPRPIPDSFPAVLAAPSLLTRTLESSTARSEPPASPPSPRRLPATVVAPYEPPLELDRPQRSPSIPHAEPGASTTLPSPEPAPPPLASPASPEATLTSSGTRPRIDLPAGLTTTGSGHRRAPRVTPPLGATRIAIASGIAGGTALVLTAALHGVAHAIVSRALSGVSLVASGAAALTMLVLAPTLGAVAWRGERSKPLLAAAGAGLLTALALIAVALGADGDATPPEAAVVVPWVAPFILVGLVVHLAQRARARFSDDGETTPVYVSAGAVGVCLFLAFEVSPLAGFLGALFRVFSR